VEKNGTIEVLLSAVNPNRKLRFTMKHGSNLHHQFIDFLFPQQCLLCSQPSRQSLCGYCSESLPRLTHCCQQCSMPLFDGSSKTCAECLRHAPDFDYCFCPFLYRDAVSRMIISFKQHSDLASIQPLLSEMLQQLSAKEEAEDVDALLPVPSHWRKRLKRGFNPPEYIANQLSRFLQRPLLPRFIKARASPDQKTLKRKQRLALMDAKFTLRPFTFMPPKHVAIVDDVVTTGATASVIAKQLKSIGVKNVSVWALARTP
jgi:ComF family protein